MCFVNPFCTNSPFYFHACKYCVSDATEYWKTQLKGNIGTKLSKNSLFCLCLFKAPFLFRKSFYFLQLKLIRKYFRNVGQISTSVLIYRLLQKIIAPQPTFMRHSHFYLDQQTNKLVETKLSQYLLMYFPSRIFCYRISYCPLKCQVKFFLRVGFDLLRLQVILLKLAMGILSDD